MLSQRVAEAFDAWFARLAAARGVRLVVVGRADVLRLTVSKRHARGRVRRLDGSVRGRARSAARAGERIPARDAPDRPTPPRPLARRAAPRRAAPQLSCASPHFCARRRRLEALRALHRRAAARGVASLLLAYEDLVGAGAAAQFRRLEDFLRVGDCAVDARKRPPRGAASSRSTFSSSSFTAGACAGAIARTPGTPRPTWPTGPPSPTRSAARRSQCSSPTPTTRSPPARSSRRGRRRPVRRRRRRRHRRPPQPQASCFSSRAVFLLGLRGVGYILGKNKKKIILSEGVEPTTLGLLDPRSNQLSYACWAAVKPS